MSSSSAFSNHTRAGEPGASPGLSQALLADFSCAVHLEKHSHHLVLCRAWCGGTTALPLFPQTLPVHLMECQRCAVHLLVEVCTSGTLRNSDDSAHLHIPTASALWVEEWKVTPKSLSARVREDRFHHRRGFKVSLNTDLFVCVDGGQRTTCRS